MSEPRVFGRCSKCGEEEPAVVWRPRTSMRCPFTNEPHLEEHFDVSCRRCGYTWGEPVVKATEAKA